MQQPMLESSRSLIQAEGLSKRYRHRQAVSNLSFTVRAGEVCALLGPNGAGKTSTMRILVGLSRADHGTARLLGEPVGLGAPLLRRVGVLIDGAAFVPHLTGLRNLRLLWSATGQPWPPPALADALALAGLEGAIDQRVKSYSMGMKQRLMLAQAVMRAPRVLILDEPANGLDPAEVRALREYLAALARDGAAILVSSHQLAEVQQLATHAVVMNHGHVVAHGPLANLLGDADTYRIEVDDPQGAIAALRQVPGVSAITAHGATITVTSPQAPAHDLVQALTRAGIGITAVGHSGRSLEEAFLTMTEGDDQHAPR
jgi:ABC-2 type transport system ATP-binding protein